MKKLQALFLVILLTTASSTFAVLPGDRNPSEPFEPFVKKLVRIIRFIIQPHDGVGVLPPHP